MASARIPPPTRPEPGGASPPTGFVRAFILANPRPAWGRALERQLREDLTASGFTVTRLTCLAQHPVVRVRMRGPAGIQLREVRRRLRRVIRGLGEKPRDVSAVTVSRSGLVEGAFVMDYQVGNPGLRQLA